MVADWYFVASQSDDDGDGDIDGDGVVDTSFLPLISSVCRVLRFHTGTMAAGSFLLAAVRVGAWRRRLPEWQGELSAVTAASLPPERLGRQCAAIGLRCVLDCA